MKKNILLLLAGVQFCISGCNNGNDSYPVRPEDSSSNSFVINTMPFKIGSDEYLADYRKIQDTSAI